MVPSSPRITRGDPVLAQARAQSALTGFLRFLMNAQAESRTYPVTVAGFSCADRAQNSRYEDDPHNTELHWRLSCFSKDLHIPVQRCNDHPDSRWRSLFSSRHRLST